MLEPAQEVLAIRPAGAFFGIFLLGSLGLGAPAAADPPTPNEQQLFNDVLGRVQGHAPQWPRNVNGAIGSTQPGCYGFSTPCPNPPPVGVTYTICTTLVAWSANPDAGDEAAAYVWDASPSVTPGNPKSIRYDNEIMLDPGVFGPNEGDALGRLLNEGLLYHELLHGQLGIDSLLDPATVALACACNTPDPGGAPSDPDHGTIHPLQDAYLQNVASLTGDTTQSFRPELTGDASGSFEIRLGQKNGWTGTVRLPEGGNVESAELVDPNGDGSIVLRGKLKDPSQKGHVLVLIDPAALFLYYFVAVAPAASVPALGLVGVLLAAGLLFALGVRRRGR